MKLSILAGATSQTINVFVQDSSSTTGAGLTGLVYNSASLTAYYVFPRATAAAITLATLAAANSAWSSGGFKEIDATNMPGWYRLDLPDAVLASGNGRSVGLHLKGATNMAPLPIEIELTGWNNQDGVRGGLTALPNATAGANTGLPVVGTQIPNATAGASGGVLISGANSGTTTLGALTITGAMSINGTGNVAQTGDNYARLGAPAGASVSADIAAAKVDTSAIKAKTDFLPSATAGAAGGVFIAGSNAATSITTALTANIIGNVTGNVSGSVGSVTGAVASVTGNVGGNVVGSVASVTARVTANTDQLAGQTVTAAAGVTFPSSVASPTNITAGTITTVTNLTNAPTAGDFTATMKASIGTAVAASAVASVTGNVGGNVTGSVGSVASGGITATSIAADAIGASELAADAVTEIAAGVWAAATRTLSAGTNIVLAKGVGITGFNDLSAAAVNAEVDTAIADAALATAASLATVAGYVDTEVVAIKQVTDKLHSMLEAASGSPGKSRFTANALVNAPNATGPSAAAIADAVWDEVISGHLTGGTTGAALNAAGSAGDPWSTPLPGAYGAGTAGFIVADILGVTGKLGTTLTPAAGSPGEYQFTADALELAPTGAGGGGSAPSAAAVAAAVWAEALPGAFGAGQAGKILGDNLNATISSRATQTSVDTVDGIVDNILLYTAEIGAAGAGLTALASAANLAAAAGYIDTEVAAIKAKTDNLPASPAATSDIPSAANVADAVWDEALSGHVGAGAAGLALRDADLRGSRTVARGTVGAATTPSTTQFTPSALSPAGAAADQFKGRIIAFDADTATPELRGQFTDITASSAAGLPLFTFTALTTAPSSGDTFSIL